MRRWFEYHVARKGAAGTSKVRDVKGRPKKSSSRRNSFGSGIVGFGSIALLLGWVRPASAVRPHPVICSVLQGGRFYPRFRGDCGTFRFPQRDFLVVLDPPKVTFWPFSGFPKWLFGCIPVCRRPPEHTPTRGCFRRLRTSDAGHLSGGGPGSRGFGGLPGCRGRCR